MDANQTGPGLEAFISERIKIVIPSQLQFVDPIVSYLSDHLIRFGFMDDESSVGLALNEALTNAIRHGNKLDVRKKVEVLVEFDCHQAVFTITDEGEGFDPAEVCDPTEGDNLFRDCGRGLLMMRHLMDDVRYNQRGNQITMIKKPLHVRSS